MSSKKTLGSILLLTTSFVGGMAAGLLLAPKSGARNRVWLSQKTNEMSDWLEGRRTLAKAKGEKKLRDIRSNVQQGIRHNVPDLYEATEHIDLSEHDLTSG